MNRVVLIGLSWALLCAALCPWRAAAQEASEGVDLRATVSAQGVASSVLTEDPRDGSAVSGGFRGVLYPTFKMSDHWTVTGAVQLASRPYYYGDFSTVGYGVKGQVLQASLNYARVSDKGSLQVRVGQMSTAFGAFLLRYDDAENALVDLPVAYGYYYAPVSMLGVAGAQVDVSRGKWDARAQFANSSPANPRSLFARDQYGNWAGGAGYTIRQGLRVGVSGYRGPYLDRHYAFFFPGEANPNTLVAHAVGVDAAWSHGHWSVAGEYQTFLMPYKLIADFHERAGYAEAKWTVSPRWYVAARNGYSSNSATGNEQTVEGAAGFRPNRFQVVKVGYEFEHLSTGTHREEQTVAVQWVTTLHGSAAR